MIRLSSPRKRWAPWMAMTRFSLPRPWTIATAPDSMTKKSLLSSPAANRTSPGSTVRTSPELSQSRPLVLVEARKCPVAIDGLAARPLRLAGSGRSTASSSRASPARSARVGAKAPRAAPRPRRRSACHVLRPACLRRRPRERARENCARRSAASASSSSSSSRRATESRSSCEKCSRPASNRECASQNFPWTAASSESSAARSAPGCSSASGKCRQTRRRASNRSRRDFTGRLAAKQNGQPKSPYSTRVSAGASEPMT